VPDRAKNVDLQPPLSRFFKKCQETGKDDRPPSNRIKVKKIPMAKKRRKSRSPGVHGEVCSSDDGVAGRSGTEMDEKRRPPMSYSSELFTFLHFADFQNGQRVQRRGISLAHAGAPGVKAPC